MLSTISSIGCCILLKVSSITIRSMKSSLSSTFEVSYLQLFISAPFLAANKSSSKTKTKVTPYICTSWTLFSFESCCLIDVLCLEIALWLLLELKTGENTNAAVKNPRKWRLKKAAKIDVEEILLVLLILVFLLFILWVGHYFSCWSKWSNI